MDINYNSYPVLLYTSYTKETAPEVLPFEVDTEKTRNYLSECKGFNELFAYIAAKNTLQKNITNYYLSDKTFNMVDDDSYFRDKYFMNFFQEYIKGKYGTIIFKNGGQYVYTLLGNKETESLKKRSGRYIAVALFMNNFFIGFEEGYITEKGIQVENTGYYNGGMDVGGYISFVIIALSYAGDKTNHPLLTNMKVTEDIFCL